MRLYRSAELLLDNVFLIRFEMFSTRKVLKNKLLKHIKVFYSKNLFANYHTEQSVYGYMPKKVTSQVGDVEKQANRLEHARTFELIDAFRSRGHLLANLDPLNLESTRDLSLLGVDISCLEKDDSEISTNNVLRVAKDRWKAKELIEWLAKSYCGTLTIEYMHLSNAAERQWISQRWESWDHEVSEGNKKALAEHLLKSEVFDHFLATKFATVKRYGAEGAESMVAFFFELFKHSCELDLTDIIIGMPHRGRLNLLTGLLNFPPVLMFQKMTGRAEFDLKNANGATGDVLSHLFTSVDLKFDQKNIHVSLLPNPSHLEAISPVVCGKSRGKAMTTKTGPYAMDHDSQMPILSVQIHGDAAFTGQGVIMETLSMANVPHFSVNGSIHLIVNNQIGFTTPGLDRGRSTLYCSDVMKMIEAPCIHVNGDYPEDLIKATKFALEYRQKFGKDIAIDLICYRQWGHNEMDDPTFTNPLMYKSINSRKTTPQKYAIKILNEDERNGICKEYHAYLNEQYKEIENYKPINFNLRGVWKDLTQPSNREKTCWDTGVDIELLKKIGLKSTELPESFEIHPTLNKVLKNERIEKLKSGKKIDWATAETLAFGSLLSQGFNVRISGQDVGRGTFSQRHVMIVDQNTGNILIPLNKMEENQKGFLEVANSILSEEAVLGFEYGLSLDSPKNLVIWEAQFGDFFNAAQIIFDTFISSGETKWMLQSGITILLPHGYDGAGPEHSSCRIERFLQMCDSKELGADSDNINWTVANPTTPVQYFHLLRRQMIRNYRKPLIVASPKILLRHPECVSSLSEFESPHHFKPVLGDQQDPKEIRKIIFCSGKHFYTLIKEREERKIKDTAIIRIEELCPFPVFEIANELLKYKHAKEFIWSQEEHQNMGAWNFIMPRFKNNFNCGLKYAGRSQLSAPAVGIGILHKQEINEIIAKTFETKTSI